jgi:hypothetical protein
MRGMNRRRTYLAVIVSTRGRLGNQIFQYCGARALFPGERLLLMDFGAFDETFEPDDACVLGSAHPVATKAVSLLLRLRALRLFRLGSIENDRVSFLPAVSVKSRIMLSTATYQFYDPSMVDVAGRLRFRSRVTERVEEFLQRNGLTGRPLVFLHVRRGDYLAWPSLTEPAAIGIGWYEESLKSLQERVPGAEVVVLTDDIDGVRSTMSQPENVHFSDLDAAGDLGLMARCVGGVLSASSLSWWGAHLAQLRMGGSGVFIGPRFWLDRRAREWFPPRIESEWIEFADVRPEHELTCSERA